jgi:K+-sensing histidine kinase KdpD
MKETAEINKEKVNEETLKELLHLALREIMSVLGADSGSLFLFDYTRNDLVLDLLYNDSALNVRGLRQQIGQGVAGKVADIKEPVLVKDIKSDFRFKRNGYRHYRTDSFISIPLMTEKGLIGVINIADKHDRKPFEAKDLDFASSICKFATLALDRPEKLDKKKVLLEKYASLGKLAAGVVHEINNPLDGIIRYTNMLLGRLENSSAEREYLLEVQKGLARISNISRSLLEFSHLVNSEGLHNKKFVDIHDIIEESLVSVISKYGGTIQVVRNYNKSLPRILDIGLSHVFGNIITNAYDAMGGKGKLEITTDKNYSMVKISFKDSGFGIPDEIKDRIFEPFFTTKPIKGTGLGLAICNEIISKYHGAIEVHSSNGDGSIFNVLIPGKYLEHVQ